MPCLCDRPCTGQDQLLAFLRQRAALPGVVVALVFLVAHAALAAQALPRGTSMEASWTSAAFRMLQPRKVEALEDLDDVLNAPEPSIGEGTH